MQESEQIASVIATAAHWQPDGEVTHAGGFVVQLLPGASPGPLAAMIQRLEEMPAFDRTLRDLGGSPRRLLAAASAV
jgi:redox-regulated HSP33 family molecular chaperone